MKIIYKAGDIIEAHIIKGLLESHGITAHVGGFYLQGGVGDLAAMDFANVQVADEDQQRAIEIISEYEGSDQSRPTQITSKKSDSIHKTLLAIFVSILIIVF